MSGQKPQRAGRFQWTSTKKPWHVLTDQDHRWSIYMYSNPGKVNHHQISRDYSGFTNFHLWLGMTFPWLKLNWSPVTPVVMDDHAGSSENPRWSHGGFCWFHRLATLWLCQNSYWTVHFFVDLLIQEGNFPVRKLLVYQRVYMTIPLFLWKTWDINWKFHPSIVKKPAQGHLFGPISQLTWSSESWIK